MRTQIAQIECRYQPSKLGVYSVMEFLCPKGNHLMFSVYYKAERILKGKTPTVSEEKPKFELTQRLPNILSPALTRMVLTG